MADYPLTLILQCLRGAGEHGQRLPVGLIVGLHTEREWERRYAPGAAEPQSRELHAIWLQRRDVATREEHDALELAVAEQRARVMLDGIDADSVARVQRCERFDNRGADRRVRTVKGELRLNAPLSGAVEGSR